MSWLLHLYETYEANENQVGKVIKKYNDREYTLLPISHTTQNAHIEVLVTEDGEFHTAHLLGKESTLIPCTDDAASRSGTKVAPYPLHDKLSYVAGDFQEYGGIIKQEDPFVAYINQLRNWANSSHAVEKVKSIYNYLRKGRLIKDLVAEKIVYLDENKKMIEKWNKEYEKLYGEKPEIFSAVTSGQQSAFVRFNVYASNDVLTDIWKDKDMYDSFIAFYRDQLTEEDVCFVTGNTNPITTLHANKIRHANDKAKLISGNDKNGFTYRGRFMNSQEAATISYEASQKAHNALKWLIHRQGKILDNRVFLIWGNEEEDFLPDPGGDPLDFWEEGNQKIEKKANTQLIQANEVMKLIDGYRGKGSFKAHVNILILDSATTGRMGVLYYQHMNKELYLNRLEHWHKTCVWRHRYRKSEGGVVEFEGAPATKDIAFAAYGSGASDKVVKGLMERVLPCIVDKRNVPKDIIRSAVQRASNPVSMESWEWKKTLSIACALVNKEEEIGLALNKEDNTRDYLFGRLLAIAYVLEKWALNEQGEKRDTNAERYMVSFSNKPKRTWKTIHDSLLPYKSRLGNRANKLYKLIIEVTDQFLPGEFNDEKLSGTYLAGFSSQVMELENRKPSEESKTNEREDK
ncbi:type I-C CRISPR-associated protein Cas8c/Csd1 [Salicibibacter cibarius]|uniref:Type I-C CRISPR-associated protein Cas8c/Csd1 n=1 Tax=Salicibibacter cibarius TaxID=2743000 RepID=A0A7T6Z0R2_9BACI|nr:type I-C CRISPR-associated protein Cas8c/Csd1 [Salicibibacter cibarius]QQK74821.1 type I-C CRISPR-associated protein Cas8c/Csd1 [Salicibibacter cibarius]